MDLQISVFLLFILFTAGHSLSCYKCSSSLGTCKNQTLETCPSEFSVKCGSVGSTSQFGHMSSKTMTKECFADCASGSMNFGITKMFSECCDTDQCNVRDAQDRSIAPNGKTCYACDESSCSHRVSCLGNEDHCIKATSTFGSLSGDVKGCASKSFCDAPGFLPFLSDISCCEGNLCNSAESVSQSLLFLCSSLLCFFLLH